MFAARVSLAVVSHAAGFVTALPCSCVMHLMSWAGDHVAMELSPAPRPLTTAKPLLTS